MSQGRVEKRSREIEGRDRDGTRGDVNPELRSPLLQEGEGRRRRMKKKEKVVVKNGVIEVVSVGIAGVASQIK